MEHNGPLKLWMTELTHREKSTDYRNGNHYDNDRVPKSPKENLILKQFYVIAKTNKNILSVHSGIKETGNHALNHGIDDKSKEEN